MFARAGYLTACMCGGFGHAGDQVLGEGLMCHGFFSPISFILLGYCPDTKLSLNASDQGFKRNHISNLCQ